MPQEEYPEEIEDLEIHLCEKCKQAILKQRLERFDKLLKIHKTKNLAEFISDKLMSDAFIRLEYELHLEFEKLLHNTKFPLNPSKREKVNVSKN